MDFECFYALLRRSRWLLSTFFFVITDIFNRFGPFLAQTQAIFGLFGDQNGTIFGWFRNIFGTVPGHFGSLRDQFGIVSGSISPLLGGSF